MHVVERQPCTLERLPPCRLDHFTAGAVRLLPRLDALDRIAQVHLRPAEAGACAGHLIAGEAFLQRDFRRPLHRRIDGRAHHIGGRGQAGDAGSLLRLAREMVDIVVAGIAAFARGHEPRQLDLARRDGAFGLHAAEHISHPLQRARRLPVGTVVARTLGEPGQQRALFERQLLRQASRNRCAPPSRSPTSRARGRSS